MHKRKKVTDMKTTFFFLLALFPPSSALAQTNPLDFFPHHVGDRWDYAYWNGGFYTFYSVMLTHDSVGFDGSHNLFYNNQSTPDYRIDTSYNVFWVPQNSFLNYLRYKLAADSGEAWTIRPEPNYVLWAWVARVESTIVFSRATVVKTYRYNPGPPDSAGYHYIEERQLASGFGLIYEWQEPGVFSTLIGCVIAGDTIGTLVSVNTAGPELPKEYTLYQNYPNPFNSSTTIEFDLPEATVVNLSIYDLLGRLVATPSVGKLVAGQHRVFWNASTMPSGVYFIRLSTPRSTQLKKALLVR